VFNGHERCFDDVEETWRRSSWYRVLVLSGTGDGFAWVWHFGLYPLDGIQTRLVSRNRVRVPPSIGSWLFMRVIEPAAFLMTRRMLIGLKRRAETLAAAQGRRSSHAI